MQLKAIQFLRFVAATAVVLFHCLVTGETYFGNQPGWYEILRQGKAGVDLFFVISGFIICYAFSGKDIPAGEFLWRRAARVIPVYWFYTLGMVALLIVVPAAFGSMTTPDPAALIRSMLFLSFLDGGMPVIFVGWTLEYEAFFYLLGAGMLALGVRHWPLLAGALAVMVLLGRVFPVGDMPVLMFMTQPMLLEFGMGVLIASHMRDGKLDPVNSFLVIAALVATVITDPANRVIVAGIPAAGIVLLFSRIREMKAWADGALLLGDASYSIYLVQVFSIPVVYKVLSMLWPTMPLGLAIVVAAAATLVAGMISYLIIERPSLALLKSIHLRRVLDSA